MDIEKLLASYFDNKLRVFPLDIDGKRVWVKRIVKNLPNPVAAAIYHAARRLTGKSNEAQAEHEIESLNALRRHGFLTPEILFRNQYYVVLSDIGQSLEAALTLADPQSRARIVTLAGTALRKLHDADRWHGAARVHNMTLSGERIGFIDLENTVDTWLPLPLRKFWDLWQLGHSTAFFEPSVPLTETALRAYGANAVRRALQAAAWLLIGPYLLLKPFQKRGKRELRQTLGCIAAIYRLHGKADCD